MRNALMKTAIVIVLGIGAVACDSPIDCQDACEKDMDCVPGHKCRSVEGCEVDPIV